jgi:hypothetical protein
LYCTTNVFFGRAVQGAFFRERADLTSSTLNLWRATARIAGRSSLFEGAARIVYEAWYQFGFPIPDDYRYLADASLEIPLSRALSFRLSCSYARDNVALTGVERSDFFLVFGLSFTFD